MEDLSQRDFSNRSFEELDSAERRELRRRFEEFVTAMSGPRRGTKTVAAKPVTRWDPALHGRKH